MMYARQLYLYRAFLMLFAGPLFTFEVGCSGESGGSSGDTSAAPTAAEITANIATGDYKTWFGHESNQTGPTHGLMRTYLNETLKSSLDSGNSEHPVGSVSVKELYDSDGTTVKGFAYSEKITSGTTAESWLWYEDLEASTAEVDFFGVGLATCANCHASGADYVRVSF